MIVASAAVAASWSMTMISFSLISLARDDLGRLTGPASTSRGGASLSRGLALASVTVAIAAAVVMVWLGG